MPNSPTLCVSVPKKNFFEKKWKNAVFDVISNIGLLYIRKERRKTHFFSTLKGHHTSVIAVIGLRFFGTDTQSVGLFGTPSRFLLRSILASGQSPKVNLLLGPILGSFSGIAKRGWLLMPPNLAHIISKKLPSFCSINFPEAICGCREKLPVFFLGHPIYVCNVF